MALSVASTRDAIRTMAGRTESYTTALWNNILGYYFPINAAARRYMYCYEHYLRLPQVDWRADLVLMEQLLRNNGSVDYWPFLAAEYKWSGASDTEWDEAQSQLKNDLQSLAFQDPHRALTLGRRLFGVVAAGTRVQLYYWKWTDGNRNGTREVIPINGKLIGDLATDGNAIEAILQEMKTEHEADPIP